MATVMFHDKGLLEAKSSVEIAQAIIKKLIVKILITINKSIKNIFKKPTNSLINSTPFHSIVKKMTTILMSSDSKSY